MKQLMEFLASNPDFVEVGNYPSLKIDLKYGSTDNFMGKNVYGGFNRAYLHKIAADKLFRAAGNLKSINPDLNLLLFDCLRPTRAHQHLWNFVAGTPQEGYVANPLKGSLHSFGFAVDLTIIDKNGNELDMGTGFDSFHDLAQPRYEEQMLTDGLLAKGQHENRLLLRNIMTSAGFRQLSFEWWHYDAEDPDYVRNNFQRIE